MGKHYLTKFKLRAIPFIPEQRISGHQAVKYYNPSKHSQIVI